MNQNAKTKRGFPYVTLILTVTIVLVVAILGYSLVDSIGIIGHLDNAAKSDNIKLNESQLDVYRFHVAQNQLYYQYMYILYGMMDDPTPDGYVKSGQMDAGTFINYMLPSLKGDKSLDASAYAYAEQYLTYCEGAMEAGLYEQYKNEVKADIETYISDLSTTAEAMGMGLGGYLKNCVGNGVTKGDVETAMEYYYIGIKYAEKLHEDYAALVTLEDIKKHVEDNKASFYTSKYTTYKLVTSDNADFLNAVKAAKTADEVKVAIVNYYLEQKFEDQYKAKITDKSVEDAAGKDQTKADIKTTLLVMNELAGKDADGNDIKAVFTSTDTDAYKKAAYEIANTINTSIKTEVAKVTESSAAWADPKGTSATDLQKWLFGEGRKAGDYTVLETKTTTKDKTTGKDVTTVTHTWYVVDEALAVDTEKTKDAYYILLSDDASTVENAQTATQKAEAFYNALSESKTPEKFKELVNKYAPAYSAEVIEQISHKTMKSTNEALADWLYEEGRKEGDIAKFEVKGDSKDKDKVTGYYVAMFVEENEETWQLNGRDAIANEKVQEWFDAAVEKYHVVIDFKEETTTDSHDHDHDHDHDETTAATTEKPTESTTEKTTEATTEETTTEAPTEAQ